MTVTVINPFDGSEVEVDVTIVTTGIINEQGERVVAVTAMGNLVLDSKE